MCCVLRQENLLHIVSLHPAVQSFCFLRQETLFHFVSLHPGVQSFCVLRQETLFHFVSLHPGVQLCCFLRQDNLPHVVSLHTPRCIDGNRRTVTLRWTSILYTYPANFVGGSWVVVEDFTSLILSVKLIFILLLNRIFLNYTKMSLLPIFHSTLQNLS